MSLIWTTFFLSLRVVAVALLLTVPIGLWSAWLLYRAGRFFGRVAIETALALPLVLPPTVVGYGLLLLFGRSTPLGRWIQDTLHLSLLFTWQIAAVAVAVMTFPLFLRSAVAAFSTVDRELVEMARTLGASEGRIFASVLVPLSYRGLLAGLMLASARGLGEFGATLMVAGSIPGETETLPLALYSAVQNGDTGSSLLYAVVLSVLAMIFLGLAMGWGELIGARRGDTSP